MRISLPYDVRWGPQIPGKVRASEINGNPSLIFEEISYEDYEAGDRLLATHGHVWKTVRQMYFDAIDNKTGRLQEAYEELGLLAPKFQGTWSSPFHIEASWMLEDRVGEDREDFEDVNSLYQDLGFGEVPEDVDEIAATTLERIQDRLCWFVQATSLFELIEQKKTTALFERCNWARTVEHILANASNWEDAPNLHIPGTWELWNHDQPLIICEQHYSSSPPMCLRTPKTDQEVLQGAWHRLNAECEVLFKGLGGVTSLQEWTMQIDCGGALDAGVIQWLSQEVGRAAVHTCAANGCSNPVFSSHRVYCSSTCYERQKKRNHRQRHQRNA